MNKHIINLDYCIEVELRDKYSLTWYKWQPRTVIRNCFGKTKKIFEEGFYEHGYNMISIDKILDGDYNFIDYDNNIVYRKPCIIINYSSKQHSTFYFDTYEEAIEVYNYCSLNIKNKYEYNKGAI